MESDYPARGRLARQRREDLGLTVDDVVDRVSRKRVRAHHLIEFEATGSGFWEGKDLSRLEAALELEPGTFNDVVYGRARLADADDAPPIPVCSLCADPVRYAASSWLGGRRLEFTRPCLCHGKWTAGGSWTVAAAMVALRLAGIDHLVVLGGSEAIAAELSHVPDVRVDVVLGRQTLDPAEVKRLGSADLVVLARGHLSHSTSGYFDGIPTVSSDAPSMSSIIDAIFQAGGHR